MVAPFNCLLELNSSISRLLGSIYGKTRVLLFSNPWSLLPTAPYIFLASLLTSARNAGLFCYFYTPLYIILCFHNCHSCSVWTETANTTPHSLSHLAPALCRIHAMYPSRQRRKPGEWWKCTDYRKIKKTNFRKNEPQAPCHESEKKRVESDAQSFGNQEKRLIGRFKGCILYFLTILVYILCFALAKLDGCFLNSNVLGYLYGCFVDSGSTEPVGAWRFDGDRTIAHQRGSRVCVE